MHKYNQVVLCIKNFLEVVSCLNAGLLHLIAMFINKVFRIYIHKTTHLLAYMQYLVKYVQQNLNYTSKGLRFTM